MHLSGHKRSLFWESASLFDLFVSHDVTGPSSRLQGASSKLQVLRKPHTYSWRQLRRSRITYLTLVYCGLSINWWECVFYFKVISRLAKKCQLLTDENDSLRQMLVSLQSEVYGARLASKYLDKELAGRWGQLPIHTYFYSMRNCSWKFLPKFQRLKTFYWLA